MKGQVRKEESERQRGKTREEKKKKRAKNGGRNAWFTLTGVKHNVRIRRRIGKKEEHLNHLHDDCFHQRAKKRDKLKWKRAHTYTHTQTENKLSEESVSALHCERQKDRRRTRDG